MNTRFISSLRIAISVLALVTSFCPVTANAYTSSGIDGQFNPTSSVVLDPSKQVFNFTSIFIPNGVTVSFSGLSNQPIELLATGNINIAGILDVGSNSLWIETPGTFSLTGSLNSGSGSLSLTAGVLNLAGSVNTQGGTITVNDGIGIVTGGGGSAVTICSLSNCSISAPPIPEPSSWALLIIGLGALVASLRLRHQPTLQT